MKFENQRYQYYQYFTKWPSTNRNKSAWPKMMFVKKKLGIIGNIHIRYSHVCTFVSNCELVLNGQNRDFILHHRIYSPLYLFSLFNKIHLIKRAKLSSYHLIKWFIILIAIKNLVESYYRQYSIGSKTCLPTLQNSVHIPYIMMDLTFFHLHSKSYIYRASRVLSQRLKKS